MEAEMKRTVIAAVALVFAAVLSYAGYIAYEKRELRTQLADAVAAASDRLAETLGMDVNEPPAGLAANLDGKVAQTEALQQKIRLAATRRDPRLAAAADGYLASVLEVLRRQAGAARHRAQFIDDRKALAAHMAAAGSRSDSWGTEAIRLRKRVDEDYFSYQLAVNSLGNMLAGLAEARRNLLLQLPSAKVLAETAIVEARERSVTAAAAAKLELEQARKLAGRA
jgi:hypothetical protein